jgi:predicted permease
MQHFLNTLNIILPVFAVITLGVILRRIGLIDQTFLQQINRLLYYVFLPLLLFYKISTADFATSFSPRLTLAMIATLSLGALLSYAAAYLLGYPPEDRGTFSQGGFRGNLAYVGLPIIMSAYGDAGFTRAGLLMGCLVPIINVWSILVHIMAQRHQHPERHWRLIRHQLLCNPLILGAAAGIFWNLAKWPVAGVAERSLHMVTAATLPLALLTIGGVFSPRQLQGDLKQAGLATLFKLVLFPMLNLLILLPMHLSTMDLGIAVLLAATPTAAASYVMAQELGGNPRLASSIIILSTLFSAVSVTLLLLLLSFLQGMPAS